MCIYVINKFETVIIQFSNTASLTVVELCWCNTNFWSLKNNYMGGPSCS